MRAVGQSAVSVYRRVSPRVYKESAERVDQSRTISEAAVQVSEAG